MDFFETPRSHYGDPGCVQLPLFLLLIVAVQFPHFGDVRQKSARYCVQFEPLV